MRQKTKELALETGRIKSLIVITVGFVMANVFLALGFTQVAKAQTIDTSLNLATMLAAPALNAPNEQVTIMALMTLGLLVMIASSVAFMRGLISDIRF